MRFVNPVFVWRSDKNREGTLDEGSRHASLADKNDEDGAEEDRKIEKEPATADVGDVVEDALIPGH